MGILGTTPFLISIFFVILGSMGLVSYLELEKIKEKTPSATDLSDTTIQAGKWISITFISIGGLDILLHFFIALYRQSQNEDPWSVFRGSEAPTKKKISNPPEEKESNVSEDDYLAIVESRLAEQQEIADAKARAVNAKARAAKANKEAIAEERASRSRSRPRETPKDRPRARDDSYLRTPFNNSRSLSLMRT